MDVLMLCYRDEPLREFPLTGRPLEIGRGPGCDIVVHDPEVRESHFLVVAAGGTVRVHELDAETSRAPWTLAPGATLRVGRNHTVVRLPEVPTRPQVTLVRTDPIRVGVQAASDLSLVVGRGSEARRVALGSRPLRIGSDPSNDLVLHDRAVSARHCRLEMGRDGLQIRDLGSRNGTFVDGVPVGLATVDAGSMLRVGRTDLRLIARGRAGDARSSGLVAESPQMQEVLEVVERLARLPYPTLVTGESGSGKEGVARALHERGPRADGPFVAVNAGGMPQSLIESELFGHEKGAFTGASSARRGVFEQADGGTLLLDEIGELPMELQPRLLRVLETWEVRPVGAERAIRVKVRLVCATHRDLRQLVREGRFREDLYYRIAQLTVHVPPLRDRPGDVEALADFFLDREQGSLGRRRLTEGARTRLASHVWPGNARELRNVILRLAAGSAGAWIGADEVEAVLRELGAPCVPDLDHAQILELYDGNLAAAARALGVARSTFRDRLRKERAGHAP